MKRALLISGGIDESQNAVRFRNDISAFYQLLLLRGFPKDEVRVALDDGGSYDLDRDGVPERYGAADRESLLDDLDWLGRGLGASDFLFTLVTNHGKAPQRDPSGGVRPGGICTWGGEREDAHPLLTPAHFESRLGASGATKLLVFAQCHAGVFANLQLLRAVICCGCGPDESTLACPGLRPIYDEFLYHLAGALSGRYPDGGALKDPVTPGATVAEAFDYARRTDRWRTHPMPEMRESPMMVDPEGLAATLRL